MLQSMVDSGRVAGAEVLVWKDGREAHYGSAGLRRIERPAPFTRDTLVQVFSMTKPVTGVALMQLWEQGKFGLDDPLERYLPQFAEVQVYDEAEPDKLRPPSRKITIRDVLRHTAGFTYGNAGHPTDRGVERAAAALARPHAGRVRRAACRKCRCSTIRARTGTTAPGSTCRRGWSRCSRASRSTSTCASTSSARSA